MSSMPSNSKNYNIFDNMPEAVTQFKIESHPQLAIQQENSSKMKCNKQTFSRSKKKYANFQYQISFEDNFLLQHVKAFKFFFHKYSSQINKNCKIANIKFDFHQNFNSKDFSYCTWLQEKLDSIYGAYSVQKLQLYEDWIKEQSFVKFLKFTTDSVQKVLVSQFFILFAFIWQSYVKAIQKGSSQDQICKQMQKQLFENYQRIYYSQKILNITFRNYYNQKNIEQFKQFLKALSETLYLIIEGYFYNPIAQEVAKEFYQNKTQGIVRNNKQKDKSLSSENKTEKKVKLN